MDRTSARRPALISRAPIASAIPFVDPCALAYPTRILVMVGEPKARRVPSMLSAAAASGDMEWTRRTARFAASSRCLLVARQLSETLFFFSNLFAKGGGTLVRPRAPIDFVAERTNERVLKLHEAISVIDIRSPRRVCKASPGPSSACVNGGDSEVETHARPARKCNRYDPSTSWEGVTIAVSSVLNGRFCALRWHSPRERRGDATPGQRRSSSRRARRSAGPNRKVAATHP
jgi:hypothetical protein